MTTLFSFIIPCYGVEEYLPSCIDSILRQDFLDYEVIIVDDGSPDRCGEIADKYAQREARIKVIHQVNQGVAIARNTALDHVAGQWVWFVDGDDYIEDGSLSILSNVIHKKRCDTIFWGLRTQCNNHIVDTPILSLQDTSKDNFLEKIFCFQNGSILFSNNIISKFNLRFTNGIKMAEDLEFQYKYLMHCQQPISIKSYLYVYQRRENSAMTNPNMHKSNMEDCLKVANNLLQYIKVIGFTEKVWLSLRIRNLIKGSLQSSEKINISERKNIQKQLREILREGKQLGFTQITDRTLLLANISLYLYIISLRLYYKIKKIRS